MKYTFILLAAIGLAFGMTNCESEAAPKSLYEKLEREALKTGEEHNDLFFGLYFGMTKDSFLLHCAELNKDTTLYQGMGGKVEHEFNKGELKHPARMNFYPDFRDSEIFKVDVTFTYNNWAPWNKDTHATLLKGRTKELIMKWYGGNEFVHIPHPVDTAAYVKLDGNRRILLEQNLAGTEVKATFTDLKVEQEIKKMLEKQAAQKPKEEE